MALSPRLVAAIVLLCAAAPCAAPLRIAVASNFQAAFEAVHEHLPAQAQASFGSSGLLYAQIVQGRPFDVFLSADRERPAELAAEGRALLPSVYARGVLVLLANRGTPGPDWLTVARRVAVANPETAPYGRAAFEMLAALDAEPQLVNALNVAQAFHFAASGAADGAFVALAQVKAKAVAAPRYWIVPEELHAPIEQAAVVMRGERQAEAQAWLDALLAPEAQALIRTVGYRSVPSETDARQERR